jgi:hypothetical protein
MITFFECRPREAPEEEKEGTMNLEQMLDIIEQQTETGQLKYQQMTRSIVKPAIYLRTKFLIETVKRQRTAFNRILAAPIVKLPDGSADVVQTLENCKRHVRDAIKDIDDFLNDKGGKVEEDTKN